ncbi:MAG: hypothetical protein AABZ47_04070 [Planctomycetota bacterium]
MDAAFSGMATTSEPAHRPYSFLKALGRKSLPHEIVVRENRYTKQCVFKNDFFAITAMYHGEHEKVILKVARDAGLFGIPLRWIGRLLAAREAAFLQSLSGVHGIPRFISRWGPTGVVRQFVDGHPLHRGEQVENEFHSRLKHLVEIIHARGMAYVDLEKCENVLVGDDGLPYLFDFQIAWHLPAKWGGELFPARWLRCWFQAGDRYHLLKLQRRTRPDQLSAEVIAASYRRPWYLRIHGLIARPWKWLRRAILKLLEPGHEHASGERGRMLD